MNCVTTKKQNKTRKFSLPVFKRKIICWCAESHHFQVCNSTWSWTWSPSQEAFISGHFNDIKIEACHFCWNHQHLCRIKLETNQLVLKKVRRICWTWARSSHFMWANSSSRLYWPSWSRALSGTSRNSIIQCPRLFACTCPTLGQYCNFKIRVLKCTCDIIACRGFSRRGTHPVRAPSRKPCWSLLEQQNML